MPIRLFVGTLIFALGSYWTIPAIAAPKPLPALETSETLLKKAALAEKSEDWERAFGLYLQVYLSGRQTTEVRERVSVSYRRASQIRRHKDPLFQDHIAALSTADALNLYTEVLEKISQLYADRDLATPARLFEGGLDELDRALNHTGFRASYLPNTSSDTINKFRKKLNTVWRRRLPKTVREARTALVELARAAQAELQLNSVSAVALELICGSCCHLDDYTVYLTPLASRRFEASMADLAAYGILAERREGQLWIEDILPDSWAALNTGIRVHDRILRLNGRPTAMLSELELRELLRNPLGGVHELEVASGDLMPVTFRLPTPLPSVQQVTMLNNKEGIGCIKLVSFGESTLLELDAAIQRLKEQGLRSLILDLRGNTGGQFLVGVRVAERFIPSGIIAMTDGQVPEFDNRVFSSASGSSALDVPMVVLIDTKTMSAAEIVASALKEQHRATLIGMPTFGKGVVQFPFRLGAAEDDVSSGNPRPKSGTLVLTIAKVLSPSGSHLHGQGVLPDLVEFDSARQLSLAIERASALAGMR